MNSTAHDLGKFSGTTLSSVARTVSPVVTPKRWIIGKVGEWLQGVDREGVPVVYALTVASSPFRTLTSVEPARSLVVTINPEAPAESAKVQKAIKELAISYGLKADCTYRVTITGSPPRGKGLGSSSIDIASALLAIKELHGWEIYGSRHGDRYGIGSPSRPCPSILQRRVSGTLQPDRKRSNREPASRSDPKRRVEQLHLAENRLFGGPKTRAPAAECRPDRRAYWNNPGLCPAATSRQRHAKIYLGFRGRPVFGCAHGL
jgi:hypothetical protein